MRCRTAKRLIPVYIDKRLDNTATSELESHFRTCKKCSQKVLKLLELDNSIRNIYSQVEPPPNLNESLNSILDNISINNTIENKKFYSNIKGIGKFFSIYKKKLLFGTSAVAAALLILLLFRTNFYSNLNSNKGLPAYIINQKTFTSLKDAKNYIKNIPFVSPSHVPPGYKLDKIVYTMEKDHTKEVELSYSDNNYNELRITYTLIIDNTHRSELLKSLRSTDPECIRVDTDNGYAGKRGAPQTKENQLSPMTQKNVDIILGHYELNVFLDYNSRIPDEDKSKDNDLIRIVQDYLNSEICSNSDKTLTITSNKIAYYSNFKDLEKALPENIKITEPNYIPKDFKLKNIKYYMVNPNINYFIISAIYENPVKSRIYIDYRMPKKGGIIPSINNKIQSSTVYILKTDKSDKTELYPITEKRLPFMDSRFDLNIYLQYDKNDVELNSDSGNIINNILKGIENK